MTAINSNPPVIGVNRVALTRPDPLVALKWLSPALATLAGGVLIAIGSGEPGAMAAVWPMFFLALLLSWVTGSGQRVPTWTGTAMFGICILVAGVAHVYQTTMFGSVFVTGPDVLLWHDLSKDGFSYSLPIINAPYAVNVWRAMYELAGQLGLGGGLWVGTLANALLMGIVAVLTVRMVGMLFPDDRRRAKLAARLVLSCGIFWLFGGMLMRDSFAVLIQLAVVMTIVHLLLGRVTLVRLLTHAPLIILAQQLTYGIRLEMLATFPIMFVLAAVAWGIQGRGLRRLAPLLLVGIAATIVGASVFGWMSFTLQMSQQAYLSVITDLDAGGGGLGYRLVVSQPLPIRVLTGLVYMHLFPIPLWYGFSFSQWDYYWLKSIAAVFIVGVTPLAALGFLRVVRPALKGARGMAALMFLALYWPTMVAAVAATSLESRHVGQFIPALIVLAVVPDLHVPADRRDFRRLAVLWYGGVVLIHLAWLTLR